MFKRITRRRLTMSTTRAKLELVRSDAAYRDAEGPLRARRAELILQRRAEAESLMSGEPQRLYARRVARSAAAVAVIACVATLPVVAVLHFGRAGDWATSGELTLLLLAAWPLALATWLIARPIARSV